MLLIFFDVHTMSYCVDRSNDNSKKQTDSKNDYRHNKMLSHYQECSTKPYDRGIESAEGDSYKGDHKFFYSLISAGCCHDDYDQPDNIHYCANHNCRHMLARGSDIFCLYLFKRFDVAVYAKSTSAFASRFCSFRAVRTDVCSAILALRDSVSVTMS